MKFAFFDVDNTLYSGYTASELIEYIERIKPKTGVFQRYQQAVEKYQLRKIDYNEISQISLDLASESLTGISRAEAEKIVCEILQQKKILFNDWVINVLRFLKRERYRIILVSAGPDITIKEIAKHLDIDEWFATEIELSRGVYTGKKTHLLNESEKSKLIDNLLASKDVTASIAFGDSIGDIPMLERVDKAFVVKSYHHPEMMEYAEKRGWIIFENSSEVINKL